MIMSEAGGTQQKNTAYGVFVQACWAQHKRQYPDELIHKEIEEFNKQCSVWWYNLSDQERERFQEMADRSNAQQAALSQAYTQVQTSPTVVLQTTAANSGNDGIATFGYSDYGLATQGQVVNAVMDNNGQVINYSTNAAGQPVQVVRQIQHVGAAGGLNAHHQMLQNKIGNLGTVVAGGHALVAGGNLLSPRGINQKPMKDPNAPKKPLSAYFLFSQEERLKVKNENPDFSITEVAKELGKRWANLDPNLKQNYEQRYQESRRSYDVEMSHYKPQKKKKDPNAPKQPLSAYFIFSTEERLKVKEENPNFSICDVAKELGKRWAEMDPGLKQRYQARAEEERQKYDAEMASYRQAGLDSIPGQASSPNNSHPSPSPSPSYTTSSQQQEYAAGLIH